MSISTSVVFPVLFGATTSESTTTSVSYPKYYIQSTDEVEVGDYEQYVVHQTKYIRVAGSIRLGTSAMLIIV